MNKFESFYIILFEIIDKMIFGLCYLIDLKILKNLVVKLKKSVVVEFI